MFLTDIECCAHDVFTHLRRALYVAPGASRKTDSTKFPRTSDMLFRNHTACHLQVVERRPFPHFLGETILSVRPFDHVIG